MVLAGSYHALFASKIAPPSIPTRSKSYRSVVTCRSWRSTKDSGESASSAKPFSPPVCCSTSSLLSAWWCPLLVAQALPFFPVGAFGIPLTVAGAIILLGAWIAEGFAHPRQPPHR